MRPVSIKERSRTYTTFVDVEVDVRLDEMGDSDLIEELKARGIRSAKDADQDWRDILAEIADEIRRSPNDALLLIERTLSPKWRDPEIAQKKYDEIRSTS